MAQLNFDATQVAPDMGFDTVPAGWYNAMIDETDMKPTKDGSGAYLQTRFSIVDGQYAGRKVFTRLNIKNSNPVAQEIAYKQLSAIAHAIGVMHIQDSSQLHGIPLKIKVSVRKDTSGQYEDSNEIKAFKNIDERVDMGSPAPAAPAMPAGFGAPAGFAPQPPAAAFAPQQAPMQAAPAQAPQQPWQQAPTAAPMQPPAQPAAAPAQPWQQPAAAQPWQQAPMQQAPVAPAAAPMQQAPAAAAPHPAQSAIPPWQQ